MLFLHKRPNSFGGFILEIDTLFKIFINQANENFVVDFKEHQWIGKKTHFSFISNKSLEETILEAFDKAFIFFQLHPNYNWSEWQKELKVNQAFRELNKFINNL
ncbi:MAG: hypothetical protein ACRC8Z_12555 [Empedobacter falsenii]